MKNEFLTKKLLTNGYQFRHKSYTNVYFHFEDDFAESTLDTGRREGYLVVDRDFEDELPEKFLVCSFGVDHFSIEYIFFGQAVDRRIYYSECFLIE